MQGELDEWAEGRRATIRLLASTAAAAEHLPIALAPFLARRPQVDIDLRERQSTEIAAALAGGHADIGILSEAAATGALERWPFAVDRLVIVAPRAWARPGGRVAALCDLRGEPFIGLSLARISPREVCCAVELWRRVRSEARGGAGPREQRATRPDAKDRRPSG
jgi:DNA-binding transcriptional LysR family regulator